MSNEVKRSCNSCKFGLFDICAGLKNNKEYQEMFEDRNDKTMNRILEAHEFKSKYLCDEYKSMYIEYPIEVSKINSNTDKNSYRDSQVGRFAKIKPCGDEYVGKTYLGLFLGELPIGHSISHNMETKELNVSFSTNPAIFVFDLNKIVYGMESWWGIIESEEDLKEITNDDINDVWYVKALKELSND